MTTRMTFIPGSGFVDNEDLSFNTAPSEAETHQPLSRVYTGAIRHTVGTDEAQQHASGRYSAPISGSKGDSVMATLSKWGTSPSVEMQPGNPASRTTLEVAASMGLIRKDEAGNWVDAASAAEQASAFERTTLQEPPEQEQQPDSVEVDRNLKIAFDDAIAPLPQRAFDVAQAHAVAGVLERQPLSQLIAEVGTRLATDVGGMEPEQGAEVVQRGYSLYEGAVARIAEAEGIPATDKPAFYKALREGPSGRLQDALQRLIYSGDAGGFRELAREYSNANPTGDVAFLKSLGWELQRTSDGWLARPPGGVGTFHSVKALVAGMKKV